MPYTKDIKSHTTTETRKNSPYVILLERYANTNPKIKFAKANKQINCMLSLSENKRRFLRFRQTRWKKLNYQSISTLSSTPVSKDLTVRVDVTVLQSSAFSGRAVTNHLVGIRSVKRVYSLQISNSSVILR